MMNVDFAVSPIRQEVTNKEEQKTSKPWYYKSFRRQNLLVLTGVKGSTKTCNLVRWGLKALAVWHLPVFSDFAFGGDLLGHHFEPEPLPDNVFVTYCKGIPPYSILIVDEIQEFFDRQNWASVESKLGVSVFQQIRKLNLTVIGATQFFHYLNPRINDQVDVLIKCKDAAFTEWGLGEQIARGREAVLEYFDLLGSVTGHSARNPSNPHFISGNFFFNELVFTEPYWRFFDSNKITAIENRFRTFSIKKEKVVIPGDGYTPKAQEARDELRGFVLQFMDELRANKKDKVVAGELLAAAQISGFNTNHIEMGKVIRSLGIPVKREATGFYYSVPAGVSEETKDAWLGTERGVKGERQGAQLFPS